MHKLLTGIEFLMQFTGFELAWQDIAEPGVAHFLTIKREADYLI